MLEYKDEQEYLTYVNGLKNEIRSGRWRGYMESHSDPGIYLKSRTTPNLHNIKLSQPYYSEIPIDLITGCNTSDVRKEIPSNFERVISAVPYILKNECMPIAVIKYGDEYYIENGKHRFYAHILLQKNMIPVSIREVFDGDQSANKSMIAITRPYYNNDGMDIAYPEKALEFFDKYREFFHTIEYVEMTTSQDLKNSTLKFSMYGGDSIELSGCCTAGNGFRSSRVTCEILNKCGYQVDMKYIENNSNFTLRKKHDAHNIDFDVVEPNWEVIENIIIPNIKAEKKFECTEEVQDDLLKLHSYILGHRPVGAPDMHFSIHSSYLLSIEDKYYYIVGYENRKNTDSIYVFEDSNLPFNNLTIKFLGTISSEQEMYKYFVR